MIGYVSRLIRDHVLTPQATVVDAERRAFLDPEATPLGVEAQELDLRGVDSVVVRYEIGGSVEIRHTVNVAVNVDHGDPAEATRLRDAIVLDLVLRYLVGDGRDALEQADPDAETGQQITAVDLGRIDYAPLGTSDTSESAVLPFVVTTQVDR